ncbi:diguanylate cyclase domain-containing protein [Hyphomonas sp.]|uniref:diguanylate cyclase domain-containing protein n=1 Tax=Hyphomonas sp. TaxID=87 RepID=UPI003919DA1F
MTISGFSLRVIAAAMMLLVLTLSAQAEESGADARAFAPAPVMDIAQLAKGGSWRIAADYLHRADQDMTPDALIEGAEGAGFAPITDLPLQVRNTNGEVWIRFRLANSSNESRSAKFYILFPYLEQVDLFAMRPDGDVRHSSTGAAMASTGKAVSAPYPAFHLQVPAGETLTYFVRIRSSTIMILPLQLASESAFTNLLTTHTLIWSLLIGAALGFAIYAASMSLTASKGVFRIYVGFALASALYIVLSSGVLSALIGDRIDFNLGRTVYFAQAIALAFGTIFMINFLSMQTVAPRLYRAFYVIACLGLLTGVSFVFPSEVARVLFFAATGAGPLVLAGGLVWMAARDVRGARSAAIAWLPCLLATVWIYLRLPDVTPYLAVNHFLLPVALAFTLAYLSALLGGQVRESDIWANSDSLTGLGNRRLLTYITELENRQPGERYGAAVAIDLDRFKPVNDAHGHAAGDAVLVAVAERLRTQFAGRGDLFRLGGDEFLVLGYQSVTRMEILERTDAFLQAMSQPVMHEAERLTVGASAGVAFHDHRHGFAEMLKQADSELYHVKQSGRGGLRIADQRKRNRRGVEPVILADNDIAAGEAPDAPQPAPFPARW